MVSSLYWLVNLGLIIFRAIRDEDAIKVADAFYEYFFQENNFDMDDAFQPDTTRAALALHHAVAKLRRENVPFIRWVPFIHLGR